MSKVKVVFVGVGGYGDLYLTLYDRFGELYRDKAEIVGIVDPFVQKAPKFDWIKENGYPVFNTLDEFYSCLSADLAVISTPIHLHKEQCLTALKNGSNVLCEKPLVPTVQEAEELKKAAADCGKKLGVGFQWSFSETMNRLKDDIMNGEFGRPLLLKSLISWKRTREYYSNGWKGHLKTAEGKLILDSVVTNATAHYLHNIFFILGESRGEAAIPTSVTAEVYRSKPIESFDTAVMNGRFANGAEFWYGATHSGDRQDVTSFVYEFEKGVIRFNDGKNDDRVYGEFSDGRVVDYGNPQEFSQLNPKFLTMIDACLDDGVEIPCVIDTILPHLKVCNGLFGTVGIKNIAQSLIFESTDPDGTFVKGLSDGLALAYRSGKLPSELGIDFAGEAVTFCPGDITRFEEVLLK